MLNEYLDRRDAILATLIERLKAVGIPAGQQRDHALTTMLVGATLATKALDEQLSNALAYAAAMVAIRGETAAHVILGQAK